MIIHNDIACDPDLGLSAAVLYGYIDGWVKTNKKKDELVCWMFQPMRKMAEDMPYMSERNITRLIDKLWRKGWIAIGNENRRKYDRTKWYMTAHGGELTGEKFRPMSYFALIEGRPIVHINGENPHDILATSIMTPCPNALGQDGRMEQDTLSESITPPSHDLYQSLPNWQAKNVNESIKEINCCVGCKDHDDIDWSAYVHNIGRCVDLNKLANGVLVRVRTNWGHEDVLPHELVANDWNNVVDVLGDYNEAILP